jgi:hypothetical protein
VTEVDVEVGSMGEVPARVRTPGAVATSLDPSMLIEKLSRVGTVRECAAISREATGIALAALLAKCICAGRAQEIAGYGDKATSDLADAFRCSKKTIERWGQIYRDVVKPRVDGSGSAARFVLEEQAWYAVACIAAPIVERPAVELIVEAEKKWGADPKYTAAQFRRDLLGLPGDGSGQTKLERALGALASLEDEEIDQYVEHVDPRAKLQRIEEAYTRAGRVLKGIRERIRKTKRAARTGSRGTL